ncbi:MAG TPA: hypothetical protein DCM86_09045 [Verrucomicrobiales bacterium]|nr:hypothetical protein [Verrucomicrobiales bacterium]
MQSCCSKIPALLVAGVLWFLAASMPAAERAFDLTDAPLGSLPAGFTNVLAGGGAPGQWRVVEDQIPSAFADLSGQSKRRTVQRAIEQSSRDGTDERFPMLVYTGDTYGDFTFTANIKMLDGEKEQMAGLVFRYQDERNFYYVRASALGGTLYFFKIVEGIRSEPIGVRIPIAKGVWHELGVECRGNHIRILFNGKEAIPKMMDKTFIAGKVGFWTKSDSLSRFSNGRLNYTPREILAQTLVRDAHRRYQVEDVRIYARSPKEDGVKVIASLNPEDLGKKATEIEHDVVQRSRVYQSKVSKTITMTLPMHDANGDTVAAVRLVMKSFPGETEKTALNRAVPIVRMMEGHIRTQQDLVN